MKKQIQKDNLVPFAIAKAAGWKGFDSVTMVVYNSYGNLTRLTLDDYNVEKGQAKLLDNMFSAPTHEDLKKWLRKKRDLQLFVVPGEYNNFMYCIRRNGVIFPNDLEFDTYEEALENGLMSSLEIL